MENQFCLQVSEIQISYRSPQKASTRSAIKQSADAHRIFLQSWDQDKIEWIEQFKMIILNRANRVLGICEISSGGTNATVVDPKVVFVVALKANASGFIVAHNHPSGNLTPSESDIRLTRKLTEVGKFLELPLLDHLIITKEAYLSMADEGLI